MKIPKIRLETDSPASMSNAEIMREYAKLQKADSQINTILIEAGLGHKTRDTLSMGDVRANELQAPYTREFVCSLIRATIDLNHRMSALSWEVKHGRGYDGVWQLQPGRGSGYRRVR